MDKRKILWWFIFTLGLLPAGWLINLISQDRLGANPIQFIHLYLGDWTLRFLCLSLTLTPLRKVSQWKWPSQFRRMIGLYTFFYASLHILNYLLVDHVFVWQNIWLDIIESPYIMMGVIAYLIVLAMAITSTAGWQKRLGQNWKRLHRCIYFASIASIIHYFWHLKGDLTEPYFYALIIGMLLGFRLLLWWRNQQKMLKLN